MDKNIVISYSTCSNGVHCNVEASEPINIQEMLFGLSVTIEWFSQNLGIHPIQLSTALQQFIVENSFNNLANNESVIDKDDISIS